MSAPRLAPSASTQRLSAADLEARLRERLQIQALSIEDDSHKHAGHAGAQAVRRTSLFV